MAKKRIKLRNQGPVTPSLNPKMGGKDTGAVVGRKAKAKAKPKPEIRRGGKKKAKVADAVEAYCVKCKTKRVMQDARQVEMANGRPAMKGVCPECGCGLFRIGATS